MPYSHILNYRSEKKASRIHGGLMKCTFLLSILDVIVWDIPLGHVLPSMIAVLLSLASVTIAIVTDTISFGSGYIKID